MAKRPVTVALLKDAVRPALWTLVAGGAIAVCVEGVGALWSTAVVPDPVAGMVLLGLAVPITWAIVVPGAAGVGVVGALARWVDEGSWTGLRATGVAGRELAGAALILGGVAGLWTGAMTLWAEPHAVHFARDWASSPARYQLRPHAELALGDLYLRAGARDGEWSEDVLVAAPQFVGSARKARLVHHLGRVSVEFVDGVVAVSGPVPAQISYRRWLRPIEVARRIELDELSWAALAERARRTGTSGGNARYEWSVLLKRILHPIAAFLFPLALLPVGTTRRPMVAVGAAGLGYLVAVRIGDHLAPWLGPATASSGLLFTAVVGAILWRRWRDR